MVTYAVVYSIILFMIAATIVALSVLYVKRQRRAISGALSDKTAATAGEREFLSAVSLGDTAFLLYDKVGGKCVYATENISRYLGKTAKDLRADIGCARISIDKTAARRIERAVKEIGSEAIAEEMPFGDGGTAVLTAIKIEKTDGEYILLAFSDGTHAADEREKMQEELDEALRLASEKSSFLSNMSHEIRTPMNGIIGMMSIAKMNINDKARVEQCLEKAGYLANFLVGMINDILDISKIESGRMQLYNTDFDVYALADKMNNMFSNTMQSRGINYKVEVVDFKVRALVGDELRLTQVITNLVSNAQKFTPAGGSVTVTFKQLDEIADKIQFMIRVRDTGKGIAPENIRKILKPFEQEDASTSHNYGGTGLGLAITDNFVKLMGGNIVIDSALGKGSDFSVFLSLPASADQTEQTASLSHVEAEEFDYAGCRILMAEDNEINAEIAVEILKAEGASVTLAKDGEEAVDIFTENPENSFDLILMDIQMPKLNGRDATKKIRESNKSDAKSIIIVALSAEAFVEDVLRSREAGMDGHVSKPIDFDELKKRVGEIFALKRRAGGGQ